ncbi:Ribosome biogenesis protein Kri1 [Coemansia biformis]|uniref:Ribosome biogenesis protein Kri1 n=1 Tax=Coemansia biformis TaxID=1286918 RepID=A0A9W8CX57_9FUNG|nr:Ribosome biogenesis protein Kri1 [Coemansia biformis]
MSSSSGSSNKSSASSIDITKIDKKRLLRADERRRRADDEYGKIEDYLSSSDSAPGSSDGENSSDGESSSESDGDEDENGDLISPEIDAQIMKALVALQSKDKSVYDPKVNFFSEDAIKKSQGAWKAKHSTAQKRELKGMTLADYQHKVNVEHGGLVDEDEELRKAVPVMTHVQEQEALRNAFKTAAVSVPGDGSDDDGDDSDGGGLLVKKEKSEQEAAKEDAEYRKFLLESMGGDMADRGAFANWASAEPDGDGAAGSSAANADQAFLMNYILNRGWVNRDVGPSVDELEAKAAVDMEEDAEELTRAEDFETTHNLRVGEDGNVQIKRYPRDVEGSMRRKDDRRKLARERAKERKEEMKRQKTEELKRLKNQKKREILEKLKEIQNITGNTTVGFDALDLDGDFDPKKFASQMEQLLEGGTSYDPKVKPEWDDDIDISDIVADADDSVGKKGKKSKKDKGVGDDDFIMDADYLEGGSRSTVNTEALDATTAELQDKVSGYMDKHYQLGYEDVIANDLPTRFKYVKVAAVDYGLTPAEILLADDKMLNEHASVKRLAAYRPDWKVEEDKTKYTSRKRAIYIKKKATVMRKQWEEELKAQADASRDKKRSAKAGADKPSKKSKSKSSSTASEETQKAAEAESAIGDDGADGLAAKKANRRQRKKARLTAEAAAAAE